jgi:hyperosmotically inducible protein
LTFAWRSTRRSGAPFAPVKTRRGHLPVPPREQEQDMTRMRRGPAGRPQDQHWAVLAACAALVGVAGCQKTTTTAQTPAGTRSTTTVEPTAQTQQALKRAGAAVVDSAITAKVMTELLADPDIKGLSIDVDTDEGVVALKGNVASRTLADRAGELARSVDGVKSVDNRLSVKSSG